MHLSMKWAILKALKSAIYVSLRVIYEAKLNLEQSHSFCPYCEERTLYTKYDARLSR